MVMKKPGKISGLALLFTLVSILLGDDERPAEIVSSILELSGVFSPHHHVLERVFMDLGHK